MLISEIASKYNLTTEELYAALSEHEQNSSQLKKFLREHVKNGIADTVAQHAIVERLGKISEAIPVNINNAEDEVELAADQPIDSESSNEEIVIDDNNVGTKESSTEEEKTVEISETEKVHTSKADQPVAKKRTKRKEKKVVDFPSDIDKAPSRTLRVFYAENFPVKPEKIFYMDDETVKEYVDARYIVIEKDDSFVFLKKNANVVVVAKE